MSGLILLWSFFVINLYAKTEAFIVQINDRSMYVLSPDIKRNIFSVIVENKSLSDQTGKFVAGHKNLKYLAIKAGKSTTVEIENKSSETVIFIPLSPAFQEVPLHFGKKAYEIPPKE